jgi:hypothetical protein
VRRHGLDYPRFYEALYGAWAALSHDLSIRGSSLALATCAGLLSVPVPAGPGMERGTVAAVFGRCGIAAPGGEGGPDRRDPCAGVPATIAAKHKQAGLIPHGVQA